MCLDSGLDKKIKFIINDNTNQVTVITPFGYIKQKSEQIRMGDLQGFFFFSPANTSSL